MPRHPRHPRKGAFISLLFTLVLTLWLGGTLSACGSALRPGAADQSTPTPPAGTATPPVGTAQGTLHGTVVAGPTCPVERAEDPCPPKPVPGREVEITSPAGEVVATVTTDGQGHFQVVLAPGTYTVFVVGTAGALGSGRAGRVQATVRAGQTTAVTIALDTGIR
jgi:Carboxypeptidase regulatory-like domain